ncbi:MAG TPA: hypothetical protein VM734_28125 [Kofleriaceae bacterium]|jgi:hypothetical protein|nr:hypothetical protein [Kofleriaceae bacterium]
MTTSLVPVVADADLPTAPRRSYVAHALAHPAASVPALLGLGVGLYLGSLVAAVVMLAVASGAAWRLATSTRFRRAIDVHVAERRRLERRSACEERLEAAGIPRHELLELTSMLDEIERSAPNVARRLQLDELLEHWVRLAIAHGRCVHLLRSVDRDALVRAALATRSATGAAAESIVRHHDVLERRIHAWDECRARADRLGHELAAISELVRLLAQRTACPELPDLDDDLARILADLDDQDAALAALAAPVDAHLIAATPTTPT